MLRKPKRSVSIFMALVLLTTLSISGCGNAAQTGNEDPKPSAQATTVPEKKEPPKAEFKPSGPITAFVPAGAGGSTDLLARAVEKVWTKYCPEPITIVNKGGAAGAEAVVSVKNSKPDGQTILLGYGGADLVSPHMQKMPYDILTDVAPVARLSIHSNVLGVSTDSQFNSLKEIIEWAKKENKPITSSVTQGGGTVDLLVRGIGKTAGVEVATVPTTGDTQSLTMLIGNQAMMGGATLVSSVPQIRAKKMKPIAIATKERDPVAPDIPTLIEQGIDYYQWGSVKGVAVAKDSSPEIIAYYEDIFKKVCEDKDFEKAMADIAEPIQYMNAQDCAKFYKQVLDDYGKQISELGIQKVQ